MAEEPEFKLVLTQKGGQALMYNGYMYYKIRDGEKGRVWWRCVKFHSSSWACEARLTTLGHKVESTRKEHNHLPEHLESEVSDDGIVW